MILSALAFTGCDEYRANNNRGANLINSVSLGGGQYQVTLSDRMWLAGVDYTDPEMRLRLVREYLGCPATVSKENVATRGAGNNL
jgi:hypothetical protein